jgi:DNA topoisomerase-2
VCVRVRVRVFYKNELDLTAQLYFINNMKYEKLTQQEHVLKRPDMYIGNIHPSEISTYVVKEGTIVRQPVTITEGLLRIFIEPLSNAIDNVVRSRELDITPKYIKVEVKDNWITIINDGYTIPIKHHSEHDKVYIPEMLFGQLLTSSNYDDTEQRYTSGKNGVGVSITNIFSKEFVIECADTSTQKKYAQSWRGNMSEVSTPKITSFKNKSGYTSVSYLADFERFGCTGYTDDVINLFKRYIVDTGMLTKVDVFFNGEKCTCKTLLDYAKLFEEVDREELHYIKDDKHEIVIGSGTAEDFEQVSFVNGINTVNGGVHVDTICTTYFKPMIEKLAKQKKDINMREFKSLFTIWVVVNVPNPEFSSQNKTRLTAPNIRLQPLTTSIQSKILKWESIEEGITEFVNVKEVTNLKKTEKKTKSFKAIKGYDPANLIKKRPQDCTLILCEGLSAKAFAVTGITVGIKEKKGRDFWGIYALRGKLLNTRNAPSIQITKNKEIVDMIQILNLKFNTDYSDDKEFATLNYASILIMTDQDTDGFHISGLIMNFFHSMFPSLFYRPGFLASMFTPIMNIYNQKNTVRFYNLDDATDYLKTAPKNVTVKYLKGLGSSNDHDIKETFGKVMVQFKLSSQEHVSKEMDKVFHGKQTEQRKVWLQSFDPTKSVMTLKGIVKDAQICNVNFEDFLNIEMIKFSMEDCVRNLPNLYDGLKQSQRKILFACTQKGESAKMKVSQWAGFISERTSYHHGEQCLFDTIIKMAQDFPGSNNIPLLEKDGQFGTRLCGGKDAASSRYIFAKLAPVIKYLFRPEDDCILKYQDDDGTSIEPENYIPIIPMILVNGSVAIATGWSTNIPCFNPKDLITYIKAKLTKGKTPDMLPWYKGYKGTFEQRDNKFYTEGCLSKKGTTWTITELPIGTWIDNFKNDLEQMLEEKRIKTLKNYSTADKVHFEVQVADKYADLDASKLIDFFGLSSTLSTTNMVVLDGVKIQRMDMVNLIIDTFIPYRLSKYDVRKRTQLGQYKSAIDKFQNKLRFVTLVVEGKIKLAKITRDELVTYLKEQKFVKYDDSYNYLLHIPIYEFTSDYINDLRTKITDTSNKHDKLEETSISNIWLNELKELEKML